jgi:hypothetical protein
MLGVTGSIAMETVLESCSGVHVTPASIDFRMCDAPAA